MTTSTDEMEEAIAAAEAESLRTCEDCGGPGSRDNWKGGWITTICKPCAEVRLKEQAARGY